MCPTWDLTKPEGTAKPRIEDILEGKVIPFAQEIVTLPRCGRCEEKHRNFVWSEFKISPATFDGKIVATHWGMCPITEEPVLGLMLDDRII